MQWWVRACGVFRSSDTKPLPIPPAAPVIMSVPVSDMIDAAESMALKSKTGEGCCWCYSCKVDEVRSHLARLKESAWSL